MQLGNERCPPVHRNTGMHQDDICDLSGPRKNCVCQAQCLDGAQGTDQVAVRGVTACSNPTAGVVGSNSLSSRKDTLSGSVMVPEGLNRDFNR